MIIPNEPSDAGVVVNSGHYDRPTISRVHAINDLVPDNVDLSEHLRGLAARKREALPLEAVHVIGQAHIHWIMEVVTLEDLIASGVGEGVVRPMVDLVVFGD